MVALCAEPDRQLQCKLLVELRLDYHTATCPGSTHPGPKHVGLSALVGVATHHHDSGSDDAMTESVILKSRSILFRCPWGFSIIVELSPLEEGATARLRQMTIHVSGNQAISYPTQKSESALSSKPKGKHVVHITRVKGPLQSRENVSCLRLWNKKEKLYSDLYEPSLPGVRPAWHIHIYLPLFSFFLWTHRNTVATLHLHLGVYLG